MRLVHDDSDEDRDAWDEGEDDDDTLMPCPHCGRMIYDDAEQCPKCGKYVSREDAPRSRPWWVVAGVLVCLYVMLRGIFFL